MGVGRKISLGTCNPGAASYKSPWVFFWSVWWYWRADYRLRPWVWEHEILLLLPIPLLCWTYGSEQKIIVSVKNDEFIVLLSPSLLLKCADMALEIGNCGQHTWPVFVCSQGFRCENVHWWHFCAFRLFLLLEGWQELFLRWKEAFYIFSKYPWEMGL